MASTPVVDAEEVETEIKDRIVEILNVYPGISRSMLSVMLQGIKADKWRPILTNMQRKGDVVIREVQTSRAGRTHTYTKMFLQPDLNK